MTQADIIELFESTGIPYRSGKPQKQWHQVRFFGAGTEHSLNLGFSLPKEKYIADFVFKHHKQKPNCHLCNCFAELFGGEARLDKTAFCRIEIPFYERERLLKIILGYWAIPL